MGYIFGPYRDVCGLWFEVLIYVLILLGRTRLCPSYCVVPDMIMMEVAVEVFSCSKAVNSGHTRNVKEDRCYDGRNWVLRRLQIGLRTNALMNTRYDRIKSGVNQAASWSPSLLYLDRKSYSPGKCYDPE